MGGVGKLMKQVREIKRYKLPVTKYMSYGEWGNTINNNVVSMYGDR